MLQKQKIKGQERNFEFLYIKQLERSGTRKLYKKFHFTYVPLEF